MYTYYFEKLDVWQLSKEFVKELYLTTNDFPSEEKYGMVSQLRRSAVSVPTNLAEGSSRSTKRDQANFSTIAYSSLMEVLNLIIISKDLGYINDEKYEQLRIRLNEIANKINALKNKQLAN